ncbi:MAG: FAD-dependent oxidoreductase, partial [Pseudomonadota bacterium]
MAEPDVAVVGGGLAGACAAILLARGGARVVLIEKESGPKPKVCGEFLSSAALAVLDRLGVDAVALGAVPLDAMSFSARGEPRGLKLPFKAASLTREVLDEALMEEAGRAGAD